jgi:hypothetical protein
LLLLGLACSTPRFFGTIEETADKIRSYLFTMREAGMNAMPEADVLGVAGYSRTDSTGYRKVMKELTKELKHVEKSKGEVSLTEAGVAYVQQHGGVVEVVVPTMEDHQAKLLSTLESQAKAPARAIHDMWNLLIDGHPHSSKELLKISGYGRPDSTGFREVMKWMKKMELIKNGSTKGTWVFTDKVYRFGQRNN